MRSPKNARQGGHIQFSNHQPLALS